MTTHKEALKLALEEIKRVKAICLREVGIGLCNEVVIAKLEEALAQPEQEPVAFDKQILDSWTKEYKAEADYWKERHDLLLQTLKNIASDAKQSVGDVTGCASHGEYFTVVLRSKIVIPNGTKLYTTPPQRTWVGLTDKEAHELWESTDSDDDWELMKRTEAKLKEKNT